MVTGGRKRTAGGRGRRQAAELGVRWQKATAENEIFHCHLTFFISSCRANQKPDSRRVMVRFQSIGRRPVSSGVARPRVPSGVARRPVRERTNDRMKNVK